MLGYDVWSPLLTPTLRHSPRSKAPHIHIGEDLWVLLPFLAFPRKLEVSVLGNAVGICESEFPRHSKAKEDSEDVLCVFLALEKECKFFATRLAPDAVLWTVPLNLGILGHIRSDWSSTEQQSLAHIVDEHGVYPKLWPFRHDSWPRDTHTGVLQGRVN